MPPFEVLDVEVEGELPGMRAQPDGIHLVLPLVLDPGLDQVRGEDVALQQKVVVLLERVQRWASSELDPLRATEGYTESTSD